MAATELYRLALAADVPEDAWKTRLQWTTAFSGVAGLDDNFLHLSSAEQLPGTAEAHFAGKSDVMLLKFSVESMCEEADLEVRWEDVDGTKFPHVFGNQFLTLASLQRPPCCRSVLMASTSSRRWVPRRRRRQ